MYLVIEYLFVYVGEDFELYGFIMRNLLFKMFLYRIFFVDVSGGGCVGGDNLFINLCECDDLFE